MTPVLSLSIEGYCICGISPRFPTRRSALWLSTKARSLFDAQRSSAKRKPLRLVNTRGHFILKGFSDCPQQLLRTWLDMKVRSI